MRVRVEIREFAEEMEDKMTSHDEGRGDSWKFMTLEELDDRLGEELDELRDAPTMKDVRKELVDVANFCMMLYHRVNDEVID